MSDDRIEEGGELHHYGVLRRSGRYPWGSGENPYQRGIGFYAAMDLLKKKGLTETQIAKGLGFETTSQLRATKSIAKNVIVQEEQMRIAKLREKGLGPSEISRRLDIPEATVRSRIKAYEKGNHDVNLATADFLKSKVNNNSYLDVGEGNEHYIGVSPERLKTSLEILKEEGYGVIEVFVPQLGVPDKSTTHKVLVPPGVDKQQIYDNLDKIDIVPGFSEDNGRTFFEIKEPVAVDPKRVGVVFGGEGGEKKDGVIELRPGVEDLSLGESKYAQVRIKVGDDHYLKGMAVYSDDLPDGVDIQFNTNKARTENKLEVMKPLEDDPENPFKSTVRQKYYEDAKGNRRQSPINIVGAEDPDGITFPGEEGYWSTWSKNLSSQMLSKQRPELASKQLKMAYDLKEAELNDILSLTNPAIKKKLLETFADSADSAAVNLKAAALPKTTNNVILPINSVKETEVYAPMYQDGTRLALIRHPHGGIFEIPELVVNNKNREGKKLIGTSAPDAIGINYKVAQQLSGADFDGDTVLAIPTDGKLIQSRKPLEGLKNFDPQSFKNDSLPPMTKKTLQMEMGKATNLVTDMTIKGASLDEIEQAIKHSMVVIDSKKHGLDYKESARQHNIPALKKKYQGAVDGGASTIISRASSQQRVPKRKARSARDGGPVDPETGELVWTYANETYVDKKGRTKVRQNRIKSTQMAETKDARSLVSQAEKKIELIYADYANGMKAMANKARKEALNTPNMKTSKSAKETYKNEVNSLMSKLNIAEKNKPLERHAQLLGNIAVAQKKASNPDLSDDDIKKLRNRELAKARARVGAKKETVVITDPEWEAIQSGAVSNDRMKRILANTDVDEVKKLAMPRESPAMGAAMEARAKSMIDRGYTLADVASALGVSTSTISEAIK